MKEYVLEWYLEQSNVYAGLKWAVQSEYVERAAALAAFAELDEFWNSEAGKGARMRHGLPLPIRLIRQEIVAHSQPENKEEA